MDNRETGRINPQVRALEALRYDSMHIPISRSNGITAALVAPTGGLISGQSALIRLDGWTEREMAIKVSAAMQIEFPAIRGARGGFGGGGARGGGAPAADAARLIAELKELFAKARAYEKRKVYAAKTPLVAPPGFRRDLGIPAARAQGRAAGDDLGPRRPGHPGRDPVRQGRKPQGHLLRRRTGLEGRRRHQEGRTSR